MDNTPYDDVFRTLLTDCTELMIPVVNEIFHTKYTGKETICLLQNEHFIKMPDGSEQERITDSSFEIISEETAPTAQPLKNQVYGVLPAVTHHSANGITLNVRVRRTAP